MNNKYLEKVAGFLSNAQGIMGSIGSTLKTAAGAEFRPLAQRASRIEGSIGNLKNTNSVLGKATGTFDPKLYKSQGSYDKAVHKINGPMMSSNSRKIFKRENLLDRVSAKKDSAQLAMHKAQAKVGAGVAGVAGVGYLASGNKDYNSY